MRAPQAVWDLFNIYRILSLRYNSLVPKSINAHLTASSDIGIMNSQWELLLNNRTKGVRAAFKKQQQTTHMFKDPIQFGPYELKSTAQLFRGTDEESKLSTLSNTNDQKDLSGSYINSVYDHLRSYYTPYMKRPRTKRSKDALVFYSRLLSSDIPIQVVLKSKTGLFSPFPMSHFDAPFVGLNNAVNEMNGKRAQSYSCSPIQNIDLYKLALKLENYLNTTGEKRPKTLALVPWAAVNAIEDDLVNRITNTELVEIVEAATGKQIDPETKYLRDFLGRRDSFIWTDEKRIMLTSADIPYDIEFASYYLLNLLRLQEGQHNDFVKLLESANLEIVGARLYLKNMSVSHMISEIIEMREDQTKTGYEDLLKLAHVPEKNGVALLMEHLAGKGFVTVKESADKNVLYVLP
ncbi:hypothetical protein Cantr_01420 [Candida viswanathii]|uniref:Uncharacterized protein n=1 Tax=Candida viswanathii TaxID=5486 RepID=A0A367YHP0_9ASCO|nr:hypothetical protein Cantr_01420 [Candida viswanathii]